MNIECIKEKLAKALTKAERITGKNVTLPVLGCVLLEADESTLTIKATNLDLGIEIKIPVKVTTPGKVAVHGGILNNFISNLNSDKNITLEVVNSNLKVSTKHSESILKAFPVDDFPTIPQIHDGNTFPFATQDLIKGLKSVMYSASSSTMRPTLSSVMVYPEENTVIFVATDSFRLAEKRIKVKKIKEFSPLIIPFKNVSEIIRSLEDIKEDIEITLNQNQISFTFEDLYITSRLIDGTFPDYKQIIPKEHKTNVVLLKQDFVSALKISNIFSDKFSQVIFSISQGDKKFEITTKNMDVGENVNTLDAVVKGDNLTISFNYKYIIDCFQSIDSDSLSLDFSDISKPMIIRPVSDDSFLYLIMPMNK